MSIKLKKLYNTVFGDKEYPTKNLVAKNKVLVGKIDGLDAYFTHFYVGAFVGSRGAVSEDEIIYHICFNNQEIVEESPIPEIKDLEFRYEDNDSTYVDDTEIKSGKTELLGPNRIVKLDFVENYKDLIYDECSKAESIEISKKISELIKQIQIMNSKGIKDIEYKKIFSEFNFLNDKYLRGIENTYSEKEYNKYKSMTDDEHKRQLDKTREILEPYDVEIRNRIKQKLLKNLNQDNKPKLENKSNILKFEDFKKKQ